MILKLTYQEKNLFLINVKKLETQKNLICVVELDIGLKIN
jgi:hypothetical protein